MATMARIRSLAPWFMFLVGGIFVVFMVLSDSGVTEFIGTQRQNVGVIDGEVVTYQEFTELVDRFQKQQEQQTGQQVDESQMDFFRDQVWEYLVAQKLLAKKIKEFGISVSDAEVTSAIMGPNPPAFLRQQFTDSTGNFNRELYETTLRDPRNKEIVVNIETQIREQLIQEKLQNYLFASVTSSDAEAKTRFIERNIKMKSKYVFVDANLIPESEVPVTDAELQKFYNENADLYKVEAMRKVKYVVFNRKPAAADSASIKANLESLLAKMKTDTASFKSYVEIYSELPYGKDTVSLSNVPAEARDILTKGSKGQILNPVSTAEGYVIYKLIDKVKSKEEKVRASHILVRASGNDKADLDKANQLYNQVIGGKDFAQVAKESSSDGSAQNGGDLGWFGKGMMVKEFEQACYSGKVGVVQKPVKTVFGYHIIKVTDRSNEDLVVERIVSKIQPSATTLDNLFNSAQDFSYIAKENGFESEAKVMKFGVLETPSFAEDNKNIPGIGPNAALVKFAFENSVGEVSDVHRVPAGYVVSMVSDITKPGVKEFKDVKDVVKYAVLQKKRLAKTLQVAGEIKKKVDATGNVNDAKLVFQNARIDSTVSEYTTQGNVPALGRDFAFTEHSYKADLNKWTGPVKGTLGSYLINVIYKTKFDQSLFDFEKSALKREIITQKKNNYYAQWVQDLKKEADVEDNRYMFYR